MTGRRRNDDEIVSELAKEAKSLWVAPRTPVDADERLFARVDEYEAEKRRSPRVVSQGSGRQGSRRRWGGVALITAMAAGAFVFARSHVDEGASASIDHGSPSAAAPTVAEKQGPSPLAAPDEKPRPTAPAVLAAVTSGGELRVNGVAAALHAVAFHDGETAVARGGDAIFAAPGRVDWLFERGTEVSVVHEGANGGPIVLALQVGAIEAQVVPVVTGEAFAVDVEGVRVAVHGTHLRVAREERGGANVVVDLSEGVISVGAPPKTGSTAGHLYTAPAHVEFSVKDLEGTLHVDHDPTHVRPAVDPVGLAQSSTVPDLAPSVPVTSGTSAGTPPLAAPRTPPAPTPKVASATEAVNTAIHKCADETLHPTGGSLTVSSVLTVDVNPDGSVHGAINFNPPIAPEFQSCVAKTVFAVTWSEPGAHKIPIELHL